MKRTSITIMLIVSMLIGTMLTINGDRDYSVAQQKAEALKSIHLMKGVSETDFALDREPTRVEAIVILIRNLGKESEALEGDWSHPFTDVPSWANNYIGYAYEHGITSGVGSTTFGTGNANAAMFLTFMLRALGYSDDGNMDFRWDNPYDLARSVGCLTEQVDIDTFYRADAVFVASAALSSSMKASEMTLGDMLLEMGVYTEDEFSTVEAILSNRSLTVVDVNEEPVIEVNKADYPEITENGWVGVTNTRLCFDDFAITNSRGDLLTGSKTGIAVSFEYDGDDAEDVRIIFYDTFDNIVYAENSSLDKGYNCVNLRVYEDVSIASIVIAPIEKVTTNGVRSYRVGQYEVFYCLIEVDVVDDRQLTITPSVNENEYDMIFDSNISPLTYVTLRGDLPNGDFTSTSLMSDEIGDLSHISFDQEEFEIYFAPQEASVNLYEHTNGVISDYNEASMVVLKHSIQVLALD